MLDGVVDTDVDLVLLFVVEAVEVQDAVCVEVTDEESVVVAVDPVAVGVDVCVDDPEVDTDVDALFVNVLLPLVGPVLEAVVVALEESVMACVELADDVADVLSVEDGVLDSVEATVTEAVLDIDDVADVTGLAVDIVDENVVVTVDETELDSDIVALELGVLEDVVLAVLVSVDDADIVRVELTVELAVETSHANKSPFAHFSTAVLKLATAAAQPRAFTITPPGAQLKSLLWVMGALLKRPKNITKSKHRVLATVTYVCIPSVRQTSPNELSLESSDLQLS